MNEYILTLKTWYENRQMREKLLVLALGLAFLYALFSLLFFRSLDAQKIILKNDIKEIQNQKNNWAMQIDALNKIPSTPLYKEWFKHRQSMLDLQGQYKFLLQQAPTKQWEEVIKTILQTQNNITIVEFKAFPEVSYNPSLLTSSLLTSISTKIYQQQLMVVFYSNFYDTIYYLERLEKLLPNIHWDSLDYEVAQYPIAKVQLEFSIIYEKT